MTLYSVFVGGLGELVQCSDIISLYSVFVGGLGELVHLYSVFVGGPLGELVQLGDIIFCICRWSRRAYKYSGVTLYLYILYL